MEHRFLMKENLNIPILVTIASMQGKHNLDYNKVQVDSNDMKEKVLGRLFCIYWRPACFQEGKS
jgi:hypothetical protein